MLRGSVRVIRAANKFALKRQLSTSTSKLYQGQQSSGRSLIPLYTVGACALTSATMFYYFNQRIQNESTEEPKEGLADAPVEIVEEIVVSNESGDVIADEIIVSNESGEVLADEVVVVVEEVAPSAEEVEAVVAVTEEVEAEAEQQGAYNEETGEINWDCPCLGGMADGPCGEEFKAAFSCFVYSKEEPKGIECIERFKDMQNCFRKYPEVYSEELRDEEELASATNTAVMNNDIIESVEEAKEEAKQLGRKIAQPAIDLYGSAQKKIDDFHKK